jgi:hypothetical protein
MKGGISIEELQKAFTILVIAFCNYHSLSFHLFIDLLLDNFYNVPKISASSSLIPKKDTH